MGKICALGAKGRVPTLDEIERAAVSKCVSLPLCGFTFVLAYAGV